MSAVTPTQGEVDEQVFNKTKMIIARNMGAAMDSRGKGNNHLSFVYEAMAEGAYLLWIEMTNSIGYGKYSKILLTELGREL